MPTATPEITRIWLVSFFSCLVSGVSVSPVSAAACARCGRPRCSLPVEVTTKLPGAAGHVRVHVDHVRPVSERRVRRLDRSRRFPSRRAWLSPVRADSATSSVAALSNRPSAGTTSPASIRTMSPGTSSSAGICTSSPPRRTRALMIIIFWSAATGLGRLALLAKAEHGVEQREEEQDEAGSRLLQRVGCCRCRPRETDRSSGRRYWRDEGAPARLDLYPTANVFGPTEAPARGQPRRPWPVAGSTPSLAGDLVGQGAYQATAGGSAVRWDPRSSSSVGLSFRRLKWSRDSVTGHAGDGHPNG